MLVPLTRYGPAILRWRPQQIAIPRNLQGSAGPAAAVKSPANLQSPRGVS
jgi:hypothetical protein